MAIDRSGANLAALEAINADREVPIKIRPSKYLNNLVEQDHRAIKRRTRSMLGFKTFRCARILLAGVEVMHMIAKRTDEVRSRNPPALRRSILRTDNVSSTLHIDSLSSPTLTATKPARGRRWDGAR